MPCSSWITGAQPLGDLPWRAEPPRGPAHVEERLVERQRLHQRRDLAEGLHDRGRDAREGRVVGGEHHDMRAQAAWRGPSAAPSGRRSDGRRSWRRAPPRDRCRRRPRAGREVGALAGRHRGVERVHVDVQERGVGHRPPPAVRASAAWRCTCSWVGEREVFAGGWPRPARARPAPRSRPARGRGGCRGRGRRRRARPGRRPAGGRPPTSRSTSSSWVKRCPLRPRAQHRRRGGRGRPGSDRPSRGPRRRRGAGRRAG